MGNKCASVANDTENQINLEAWIAGQKDNSMKRVTLQRNGRYNLVFPQKLTGIHTIILHIPEKEAYRAVADGAVVTILEKDAFLCITTQQYLTPNSDQTDPWNPVGSVGADVNSTTKGMQQATEVVNLASKIAAGMANRAVTTALTSAGVSGLAAFAGGQIAGSLVEMGSSALQSASGAKAAGESTGAMMKRCLEEEATRSALVNIETTLIGLCRAIRHDYLPRRQQLQDEEEEGKGMDRRGELAGIVRQYLALFTIGNGIGIMPYLEYVRDASDCLALYLTAVSMHLLLLQEMLQFARCEAERAAAQHSLVAYSNLYRENAEHRWSGILEEHKDRVAIQRPREIACDCMRLKSRTKLKVEGRGVVYTVSGYSRIENYERIVDIRDAFVANQVRVLHHLFNHPERIFEQWRQFAGNPSDGNVTDPVIHIDQISEMMFPT